LPPLAASLACCVVSLLSARTWAQRQITEPHTPSPNPALVVQLGEAANTSSAAFSPDGQHFIIGDYDGTATLWGVETGAQVRQFRADYKSVYSVAWSSDGTYYLTGGEDGRARLWNASTGGLVRTLTGHVERITSVAFAPSGDYVLTGSLDKTARIWNVSTGTEVRKFVSRLGPISSVAYSPDGRYILTGSWPVSAEISEYEESEATLWDVRTGGRLHVYPDVGSIMSVSFSPLDDKKILIASFAGTAKLWETDTVILQHSFTSPSDVPISAETTIADA
jgi:WD40 repeat protein